MSSSKFVNRMPYFASMDTCRSKSDCSLPFDCALHVHNVSATVPVGTLRRGRMPSAVLIGFL
eukprot:8535564-Pyramimonas_sp.AAC.1